MHSLRRLCLCAFRLKVSDENGVGPSLLEDQIAREKIHRFDHERIPERVVHVWLDLSALFVSTTLTENAQQARGAAAHGYFKIYDDRASKYTSAPVLTDSSRTTPVFLRFSTVQGSRGSAVSSSLFYGWLMLT